MSLARQFFREFRPLFRMLEEPFGRPPAYMGYRHNRSMLDDPFFHPNALRPAVDVSEEGNHYIVEAELPGVKKENVQVRVGDGGQSVTIEGKIVERRSRPEAQAEASSGASSESGASGAEITQGAEGMCCLLNVDENRTLTVPAAGTKAVTTTPESTQLSTERSFVGSSTFTRTVWLPRRVDPSNVSASLSDGILTVKIPKAQDPGSVEIPVQ